MRHRLIITGTAVILAAAGLAAAAHNVPTAPTPEDRTFIAAMLAEAGAPALLDRMPVGFDAQIGAVLAIQRAVLEASPIDAGIPLGETREPADLYQAKVGLCFDRSRSIEKALEAIGLETRHISVFSTSETGSALRSLATPGIESHAVTEVLTDRGWMVVDPIEPWVGLDASGTPVSISDLQQSLGRVPFRWSARVEGRLHSIFTKPFTYVIGLYSRHGRFYPPMTPVPDVHWPDLLHNL